MSGLETAIRSALDRADRENSETRARIYQSARQALETGLRKQNVDDPEQIAYQRRRLETLIHTIEAEERSRLNVQPAAPAADAPTRRMPSLAPFGQPGSDAQDAMRTPSAPVAPAGMARQEPGFSDLPPVSTPPASRAEPAFAADWSQPAAVGAVDRHPEAEGPLPDMRSERAVAPRKRRGIVARLTIAVILLASIGIALWWVAASGLLLTDAERDTSVPNPPPQVEAEDFAGAQGEGAALGPQAITSRGGFTEEWLEIFDPSRLSASRPGQDARVDVVMASDGEAVRLLSGKAGDTGSLAVEVPTEILNQMAGKTSTIALTLQSVDDKSVQIAVGCELPRMGECARHRFTINAQKIDVLFRLTSETGMSPSSPGQLIINGDISGAGRGVNIYSIRVLPGE